MEETNIEKGNNNSPEMDDGTLAFLNIKVNDLVDNNESKMFLCDTITQLDLLNKSFTILDFTEGVSTKYGDNKAIVLINLDIIGKFGEKINKEFKFFTGSSYIIKILRHIKLIDKFPRKATLRKTSNNIYYLE